MAIRFRAVTGVLYHAKTGAPLISATLKFELSKGFGLTDTHLITDAPVTTTTGADGSFSINLWCDEDALVPIDYSVTLPKESSGLPVDKPEYKGVFSLVYDIAPIALSILLTSSVPSPIANALLYAVIDARIIAVGGGGGGTVAQTLIDGSTVAVSGNAVFDALALKANNNAVVNLTTAQTIAGNKVFTDNIRIPNEPYDYSLWAQIAVEPAPKGATAEKFFLIDQTLTIKADLITGKVPAAQLPDFILKFATAALFPVTGDIRKIYIVTTGADINKVYQWSGAGYVQLAPAAASGGLFYTEDTTISGEGTQIDPLTVSAGVLNSITAKEPAITPGTNTQFWRGDKVWATPSNNTGAGLTANTFTATQSINPAVNTSALIGSGYSLTGANAQSAIDISGTWNTTANVDLLSANVVNTASGANSNLINLKVGGISQFSITKNGSINGGVDGGSGSFNFKDATPSGERYLISAEANYGRKFGFYVQANGNEGGFKADSQLQFKANGSMLFIPHSAVANREFILSATSDGVILESAVSLILRSNTGKVRMDNVTGTDFSLLQFGGTTASFPALKRSAATLQVKLADDSAYGNLEAGTLYLNDGTIKQVTFGAADSAGTGFKYLKIAN